MIRKQMWQLAVAALVFVLTASGAFAASDAEKKEELSGRALISKLIQRDLKSIFVYERVQAIDQLGGETDANLVAEFQIVQVLMQIAKDPAKFPRERSAALRALVSLYKNGIGTPEVLEVLAAMVEDSKTPPIVRIGALSLLGEMGGEGPIAMSAFSTLEKLWGKRKRNTTRLPNPILAKLVEAMGGFNKISGAKRVLLDGLDEKSPTVRTGALIGLQRYLQASETPDSDFIKPVSNSLSNSKDREERIEAVRALEMLVQGNPDAGRIFGTNTKNILLGLLREGGDEEVQAAVRLLLRIPETEILEAILAAARPKRDRQPPLSFDTYHLLNMGLIEALNILRDTASKASSKAMAEKITAHFIWMLDPNNKAPVVLRKGAVFGLGAWPQEFDRTKVVQILIRLLEVEQSDEMVEEVERSLRFLTGRDPFTRKDPETKKTIPDADAWKNYFGRIKEYLEPNKTPYELDME